MEKVSAIFDEVQRVPSASNKACIPKLNKILLSESDEERSKILNGIWRGCLDHCLLFAKKEHVVDKMIDFLASFVSAKSTIDMAFDSCIEHLVQRLKATNKVIRLRACQTILRIILGTTESDKLVSEDTLKNMIDMLLPRLRDKVPGVRVLAIRALGYLQMEGDGINEDLIRLLQQDSSKEVRIAAVECICLSKVTLPLVIARVKDVRPEVRVAVYSRLSTKGIINAKVRCRTVGSTLTVQIPLTSKIIFLIKNMDAPSAAVIVRYGLGDRDSKVKEACKVLILKWLADYNNDVPKFLRLMDLEMYEEEAERLGYAVMDMVERGDTVTTDLSVAVRQYSPDWEQPFSKMVPSEILWVHIRCDYAHKNMSPVALADFVDALAPDMIKLCSFLEHARKPALYSSTKYQMIVRYLLRLTTFLDTSDICGCKELVRVCEEMLADTNLPEMLVDPMLTAWLIASSFPSSDQSIQAAVALSRRVALTPGLPPKNKRMSNEYALPGDSDEEDDEDAEERLRNLSSIRSLQIVSWSLQQNIGARDAIRGREHYDDVTELVMNSLQQPCSDLRGLAVKCLGLLALTSEEKCAELHEIIFQVARNEIEEGETRSQALEAIVDMATVYDTVYQNHNPLTTFLLRLQEGAEPALLRVGAEGSAKLLFSGRLTEPKLFANLVKFFFLPELAGPSGQEDEEEEDCLEDAFLGSTSRLQQILSVFFQAFFVGGKSRDSIAFQCCSDLVADLAMLIRDGQIGPSAMYTITNHLLALCENIKLPISEEHSAECPSSGDTVAGTTNTIPDRARNIFRARLSAAICREVLKMGCSSTVERAAVKEFVRTLGALTPSSWIGAHTARTVLTVMSTISQTCELEKASQKIIVEKIISACEKVGNYSNQEMSSEEEKARDLFHDLAPGLADMLDLMSREVDEAHTQQLCVDSRAFIEAERQQVKKPVKRTKRNNDLSDEEEDEEVDDEEGSPNITKESSSVRTGPSRGSKVTAVKKISAQLSNLEEKTKKRK